MIRILHSSALVVALAMIANAFAFPGGASAQDQRAAKATPRQPIGHEDMLQISLWDNEAMSKLVPVRPDGMISLPLFHDVQAAGLTPMELPNTLANKVTEYMRASTSSRSATASSCCGRRATL